MTAVECLQRAKSLGPNFQESINSFVDEFRRANARRQREMIRDAITEPGAMEGLVAGVVNALCRESDLDSPPWVSSINSPEPFFAFPARSYALRVRLMIESPPPFRVRNVFVPENYLSRA